MIGGITVLVFSVIMFGFSIYCDQKNNGGTGMFLCIGLISAVAGGFKLL